MIRSDPVAAVFGTVPRHAYVPAGTPLEQVYAVDGSVDIPARMIEQARLRAALMEGRVQPDECHHREW